MTESEKLVRKIERELEQERKRLYDERKRRCDDQMKRAMDSFEAAGIIDQAFPRHPLFFKPNPNVQAEALGEALRHARIQCAHNRLGDCIEWAREEIDHHSTILRIRSRYSKKGKITR